MVDAYNLERRDLQQRILDQAIEMADAHPDPAGRRAIVLARAGWHKGVLGIVASKMIERYHLPTILLAIEDDVATGSARSIRGFKLVEHLCKSALTAQRLGGVKALPEDDVQALIDAAESEMGGVDVLINNAGLGGTKLLVDMEDDEWNRVLDITLTGTMRCTRAAFRHMLPRGSGVVVNNASVLGWRAQAGQCHYAAAKAGVMALTRCAAIEGASAGVRVNAVAPSLVMHPFLHKVTSEALLAELEGKEAFGRSATPDEVANVFTHPGYREIARELGTALQEYGQNHNDPFIQPAKVKADLVWAIGGSGEYPGR